MAEAGVSQASSAAQPEIVYVSELDSLATRSIVPVERWALFERADGGWMGTAFVDPGPDVSMTPGHAFGLSLGHDLVPGTAVALGMWLVGDTGQAERDTDVVPLRTWPSMVAQLDTVPVQEDGTDYVCAVQLVDPLTFLRSQPLWAVFESCSPGEILGGALSMCAGGTGRTSLTPSLPGLPGVSIHETLRDAVSVVPYAIATGETLGVWLDNLLGHLGLRIVVRGLSDGTVMLTLTDRIPAEQPVRMTLGPGQARPDNAVVDRHRQRPDVPVQGAVLDDPGGRVAHRLGADGAVGSVISASGITPDEAALRATFAHDRARMRLNDLRLVTAQPSLCPGRLLEFTDRPVSGATVWYACSVQHGASDGVYRNTVDLAKSGVPWRPSVPLPSGPSVVSARVDDGQSPAGAHVLRDRLGRIPVTFPFDPGTGPDNGVILDTDPDALASAGERAAAVTLRLPVVDPMAGGLHGFVPAHRQGDVCRVMVHHPLSAEIFGFIYGDSRRLGETLDDVSMGFIVEHGADGAGDRHWSGMLFRPAEAVDEEDEEIVRAWREAGPAASSGADGG